MTELTSKELEVLKLEDLKEEASALGVVFSANIGALKLQEKIDDYYKSQETSGAVVQKAVKEAENTINVVSGGVSSANLKRLRREKAAKVMRVVTVIDNDQRVNNQANTCTVNCSNEFFDLGTRILPLNEKIQVCQGHINVLKSVQIPLHVRDNKTGLSNVRMRPRYAISYEDM